MIVATTRVCNRVSVERQGFYFLDTTVKSGNPIFAPTWEMVHQVKAGTITPEQYSHQYNAMMEESVCYYKSQWLKFCNESKLALGCYCALGDFCHRNLLINHFKQLCLKEGIEFNYVGDLP